LSSPSYAIGVDLGTTHSALSEIELDLSEGEEVAQQMFSVPQSVAPFQVEARALLPSFAYIPHEREFPAGSLALPWNANPPLLLGGLARDLGAKTPTRLVSSAKSWLCHPKVDRRAPILPVDASEDVARISPLEASAAYLAHLGQAWDAAHPGTKLSDQELVITVPASFDPAARELTAQAAVLAGMPGATLLEEPQAALYAWIARTPDFRSQLTPGDLILVVDVGGGTTDLSLIAVLEEEGRLALSRVAVGEHILLGGDNMDLALAHAVGAELRAEGKMLDPWQLRALAHGCRAGKEALLSGAAESDYPLAIPSRGRHLIGGTLRATLRRQLLDRVIFDGFFPVVPVDSRPRHQERGALTELGLPYARDAAITRHVAAFLHRQLDATAELPGFESARGTFLHPTAVLFNGGVFKAPGLMDRLRDLLDSWLEADGAPPLRVLEGADLDHAVARGAAYYGYVKRGGGVRIRGGTAQAYYVGVEQAMPAIPGVDPPVRALCVAPFGLEEGMTADEPPQQLGLVVGESVRFRFFGSSVRREDVSGSVLERWTDEELSELGAIEATLPADGASPGDVVPVRLSARVTELGVLELSAISLEGERRYTIELDVRSD